jgi:hypothetical protein
MNDRLFDGIDIVELIRSNSNKITLGNLQLEIYKKLNRTYNTTKLMYLIGNLLYTGILKKSGFFYHVTKGN